jgi:hypothetical protein
MKWYITLNKEVTDWNAVTDMGCGTWNVKSLHRTSAMNTVVRELGK